MEIKLVKFVNGEEILGEVTDLQNTIHIKNPIRVVIMPPSAVNPKPSVGFADWIPYVKEKEFVLDKKDILFVKEPVDEFITQYKAIFTGLALPEKPKLILS